jgi:NitT/TauT family transport system substrate-binding protein
MTTMFRVLLASLLVAVAAHAPQAAAQEKIKVGYWTSGFSVGFGAVLEAGKFLEKQGLQPEYVKFSSVNGPTQAMVTHSIDAAFAAPLTGAFTLGSENAPIEIVLATQVAEATFVAKQGSPIHKLTDLKGKKVGMSPAGSATYAIVTTVLERNYGLKRSDYTAVPGNEAQLVRFLQQGDIDAASLRAVTIASVPQLKLQVLGHSIDEWKKMTKSDAVPILGVAILHKDYARQHPEGAVKFVRALMEATRFGAKEPDKAAEMLGKAANLNAQKAKAYAKLWNQIYIARMDPATIATFKTMAQIFRSVGTLENTVPDSLFAAGPYEKAAQKP